MTSDRRSISVSSRTYNRLRAFVGDRSLRLLLDKIILDTLDDPTIREHTLKVCPPQKCKRVEEDQPRALTAPALIYGCQEPKEIRRRRELKRKRLLRYGISEALFAQMYSAQKGCCWICGQPFREEYLEIDHCHRTFKVRGLLCGNCNRGLGAFQDDVRCLLRAVLYLDPQHELGTLFSETMLLGS